VRIVTYGLTFLAGAVVGVLVAREVAQEVVKGKAGDFIDSSLGKGTWYGGIAKTFVNAFVEENT
jgi:hypothetical protein